ncbi:MAG: DNA cytosine methyltransferase, partial [Thioalkalivibrio sp.]|nr:DNA cytosine methyltransferase [Thioalkalivibrio sp.]
MHQDRKVPTYLDLFAGCGGLSLGFREAGFKCLLAVDTDPQAVECYTYNAHQDSAVGAVEADLSRLQTHEDVGAFLQNYGIHTGDCDVVIGGPPCQSFSVVGRTKVRALMEADSATRKKWEEQSHSRIMLFETYVRFIEYLQPRWFLFENVPAIRSHSIFSKIDQRFRNLHSQSGRPLQYRISHDTYLASKYGVPQNRRRFFMLGHLPDVGISQWTKPTEAPAPTVKEAIGDLPSILSGCREDSASYAVPAQNGYQ